MSREDLAILERRKHVATRYLHGQPQWEIARALEVVQSTVSKDLKAVQAAWLASSVRDFDALKAQELAKIDETERQAWAAWERSQRDAEIRKRRRRGGAEETEDVSKGQAGDPRFLEVVLKCVQKRCEIFGFLKPPGAGGPTTVVTVVGGIDLAVVTGEKLIDYVPDYPALPPAEPEPEPPAPGGPNGEPR